jgi:DNA polymerase elongation subunit (family B)
MKSPEPRTIIFDIETSLDIIAAYGLKEQYHSPNNIIQDWGMICFSWKWLGGSRIYDFSLVDDMKRFKKDPHDDYAVVKRLHEVLSDAEVMVGHNVQNFDWKKFMARVIYHGLPPIDRPMVIDTLKEARKIAKFTSNKMDYLARHLKIENKLHHAGDMWLRILRGEAAAVKEAVEYCRGDVRTTEALYLRLRPYMSQSHPNMNIWRGNGIECCTKCGSDNLSNAGWRMTTTGKYQRIKCGDCGTHMQGTKRIKGVKIK